MTAVATVDVVSGTSEKSMESGIPGRLETRRGVPGWLSRRSAQSLISGAQV